MSYSRYLKKLKEGSKTFFTASIFLPSQKREAMAFLYSICRQADDIADKNNLDKNTAYKNLKKLQGDRNIKEFFDANNIPIKYWHELIEGVEHDIDFKMFMTFEELYNYAYKVAGTVGIMSAYILEASNAEAIEKAKKLGIAMQITNILRDVQEDAQNKRIYFPNEILKKYSISLADIYENRNSSNFNNLMQTYEQIARNYYKEGFEGVKYIQSRRARFSIKYAGKLYEGILDKIAANNYNPFLGRVYLSKLDKIRYLVRAMI